MAGVSLTLNGIRTRVEQLTSEEGEKTILFKLDWEAPIKSLAFLARDIWKEEPSRISWDSLILPIFKEGTRGACGISLILIVTKALASIML